MKELDNYLLMIGDYRKYLLSGKSSQKVLGDEDNLSKMNIPKLRFKGFSGEWQASELGDVARISSGGTPSRGKPEYWGGDIPWVTTSLIDFNIIEKAEEYITDEGLKNSSAKLFPKNTLLMAMYGQGKTRGKIAILGFEATTNQACAAIILDESIVSGLFVFHNLFGRYNEIRDLSNAGGQENLSAGLIKSISINFPESPEQTKIADFLTAIDNRISQLSQKCDGLAQYKKGVMQKIFSQELRFKDEQGRAFPAWEWKNGNFIFENISDRNHKSDLPVLAITQEFGAIPRNMIDFKISVMDSSIENYKVVRVGEFIISLRSFQGGIEYANYEGICSPAYVVLRPIIEINTGFFKNYLKTENYIRSLQKNLEGIRDGKMISFKYFSEVKLPYPCIAEQAKIAGFLGAVDEKISQAQAQRDAMKQYKQGLLQQMFV